jgi:hypothetical protein
MRHLLNSLTNPQLLEIGFTALKLEPFKSLAWHVFFGRGGGLRDVKSKPFQAVKS